MQFRVCILAGAAPAFFPPAGKVSSRARAVRVSSGRGAGAEEEEEEETVASVRRDHRNWRDAP